MVPWSLKGNQTEGFSVLNGYKNIDITYLFKKNRRTRGYELTLIKDQCRLDIRTNFCSQRIVNEWNILSASCMGANSVNMFKNNIGKHIRMRRCR